MWGEFKAFLTKTNALALAIGVIIGVALGTVVKLLVDDIIMPPIGLLLGGVDFASLQIVLKEAVRRPAGRRDPLRRVHQRPDHVRRRRIRGVPDRQLMIKPAPDGPSKTCPFCKEANALDATRCKFCTQRDLIDGRENGLGARPEPPALTGPGTSPPRRDPDRRRHVAARVGPVPPARLRGSADDDALDAGLAGRVLRIESGDGVAQDLGHRDVPEPLAVRRDDVPRAPSRSSTALSASSYAPW